MGKIIDDAYGLFYLSHLSNHDCLQVFDGLAPAMGGKAFPALLVGDKSWDLTPLVGVAFIIQSNEM